MTHQGARILLIAALTTVGCADEALDFPEPELGDESASEATDDGGEPDDEPRWPDEIADPLDPDHIIGGTIYDSDRDVRVSSDIGTCSGTLLRNNIVLTARHCVRQNGVLIAPSTVVVHQDGPGATLGASRGAVEIVASDVDVAMIRLDGPFSIDGRSYGQSTQILATDPSEVVGEIVLCQGYGRSTCEGGSGILRAGLVEVASESNGNLYYEPWLGNEWIQWMGDSGSSCRWGVLDGNLNKALGVQSTGACGSFAHEVGPELYRDWAIDQMNAWAGGTFLDTFSWWPSAADIDVPPYTYGGQPQWQVSGGVLHESSNAYTVGPNFEGTRYINAHQVASDAIVSATISSPDNDSAGIIARYRDSTHYYRFSLDEQRHFARIVRRDGDDWTVIAEDTSYDIDWSDAPRISLYTWGPLIAGMVDGQIVVLGVDDIDGYTAGRAGMYNWSLSGAVFDDFEIERF